MLNKDVKNRFIKENPNEVFNERFLRQMGDYEDLIGKDCCDFTVEEILTYYKQRCSSSVASLNFINNTFRRYADFCLDNNIIADNQNHYYEITTDLLVTCVSKILSSDRILTRDYIINLANNLPNISDGTLLLALFEGICGKDMCELVNLKPTDFDNNKVKLCSGREFEVSSTLKNWCIESANTMEYNTYENAVTRYNKYNDIDSDKVFKSTGRNINGVNRKTLYNKLVRIKNNTGLSYLTTFSLMDSGRIEMIKRLVAYSKSLDEVLFGRLTEERYGHIQNLELWKNKFGAYI